MAVAERLSIDETARLYEVFVDLAEAAVKAVVDNHAQIKTRKRLNIIVTPHVINAPLQKVIKARLGLIKEAAKLPPNIISFTRKLAAHKAKKRAEAAAILKEKKAYIRMLRKEQRIIERECQNIKRELEILHTEFNNMRNILCEQLSKPHAPRGYVQPTYDGERLPAGPGIYFVWQSDVIRYVGQSVNIRNRCRLESHGRIQQGDLLSWLPFPRTELDFAECFYIALYRPTRNFGKSAKWKRYSNEPNQLHDASPSF